MLDYIEKSRKRIRDAHKNPQNNREVLSAIEKFDMSDSPPLKLRRCVIHQEGTFGSYELCDTCLNALREYRLNQQN